MCKHQKSDYGQNKNTHQTNTFSAQNLKLAFRYYYNYAWRGFFFLIHNPTLLFAKSKLYHVLLLITNIKLTVQQLRNVRNLYE